MIVVKIELHSAITKQVTTIGQMVIDNVGGTQAQGDYRVRVGNRRHAGENDIRAIMERPQRRGEVKGYPRLSYNVWRLISRAILSAFPEERK